MKKKDLSDDLEIYLDPKPLSQEEEIALSLFIKKLKLKSKMTIRKDREEAFIKLHKNGDDALFISDLFEDEIRNLCPLL